MYEKNVMVVNDSLFSKCGLPIFPVLMLIGPDEYIRPTLVENSLNTDFINLNNGKYIIYVYVN